MKFFKMHGIGNDYIFFDSLNVRVDINETTVKKLSDRHFGVGGDGVVIIAPSETADAKMIMYNADGSLGEMCGNAIRCVAKYLYQHGSCKGKTDFYIDTDSGFKKIHMSNGGELVTVNMGSPVFEAERIGMSIKEKHFINRPIEILGKTWLGTAVSMGNPHLVVFASDIDAINLEAVGPLFENHPYFPKRVNAEFAEIKDEKIYARVWERGTGETLACGTGACAVLAAAQVNNLCARKMTVVLKGGSLEIEQSENNNIFMTGKAEYIFDGEILF